MQNNINKHIGIEPHSYNKIVIPDAVRWCDLGLSTLLPIERLPVSEITG